MVLESKEVHNEPLSVQRLRDVTPIADDDVIDLRHLFISWLKWIWVPVLMGGIGLYYGYKDLQAFQPQAVASMIILPTVSDGPAVGGRVENLAAQLGLQLGPQPTSVSPFYRFQMLLGSIILAQRMQDRYGLMQRVYQGSWDAQMGEWKRPSGEEFDRDQRIRAILRQNRWSPPSIEGLANYIGGKVKIEPIEGGAFRRVTVTDSDPDYALWLLTAAYFEADEMLREQDRLEVEQRQTYINRELATATNLQVQEALRGMLADELGRKLMLSGELPYVAKIAEPPRVSGRLTEPNVRLLFGVPAVAFAGVGFLLITLIAVIRRERRA